MPKSNPNAILAEVIEALRDETVPVKIETTYANQDPFSHVATVDTPQIPTRTGQIENGSQTYNARYASGVKIGKISIRKIGLKFVVRTPNGEADFEYDLREPIGHVWNAALYKADHPKGTYHVMNKILSGKMDDKELDAIVNKGVLWAEDKPKTSKFKEAIKQMKSLGLSEKNMTNLMKKKGMEK